MKIILEELYNGNIYPDELIISRGPDYYPLNKKISGIMKMWKNKLSEDDFRHSFYKEIPAVSLKSCNEINLLRVIGQFANCG